MIKFEPQISILLVVLLALFSVQVLGQTQTKQYGGTLTVATKNDPKTFNGLLNWYVADITVNIFDTLVSFDSNYNMIPKLASSYNITDEGKTHTFYLHQNITWHDGVPFTSADVKFHYELLAGLRPQEWNGSSISKSFLSALDSIEIPDNYTVIFRYSKPTLTYFYGYLNSDNMILPKHLYEGTDVRQNPHNLAPIGTGPFKFVEYVQGDHLTLDANLEYFKGRPYMDRLIFKYITSPDAALISLQKGEVDTIEERLGIPLGEIESVQQSEDLDCEVWSYPTGARLQFNFRQECTDKYPWVNDLRVRRAITHALNRSAIVELVYFGYAQLGWGPISSIVDWAYNPDIPSAPTYNVQIAKDLLDEAGLTTDEDGYRLHLKMPVMNIASLNLIAPIVKEMLRQVGIDVEVWIPDMAYFYSEFSWGPRGMQDYPLSLVTMGMGNPDPDFDMWAWGSGYTSDKGGNNLIWYNNSRVDKLYEIAHNTYDTETRKNAYFEIQDILCEELPVIWLCNLYRLEAWNRDYHGFKETHRPLNWLANYAGIYGEQATQQPEQTIPIEYIVIAAVVVVIALVTAVYIVRRRKK